MIRDFQRVKDVIILFLHDVDVHVFTHQLFLMVSITAGGENFQLECLGPLITGELHNCRALVAPHYCGWGRH